MGDNSAVFLGAATGGIGRMRFARRRRVNAPRCVRWLALAALMFATPIVQEALTEVVSFVAHDDCGCGDDCKEHGRCPGPCQTCFCCTHSNAVTTVPLGLLKRLALHVPVRLEPAGHASEGCVLQPFRPPIG